MNLLYIVTLWFLVTVSISLFLCIFRPAASTPDVRGATSNLSTLILLESFTHVNVFLNICIKCNKETVALVFILPFHKEAFDYMQMNI